MKTLRTLHIYGSTKIQSDICPICQIEAFVIGGKMSCCGATPGESDIKHIKIELDMVGKNRYRPCKETRDRILQQQQNCCFYCGDEFGSWRRLEGQLRRVVINWDHVVPYAYDGNNDEFVAACRDCNFMKSDLHFADLEEAKTYLASRIYEKKQRAVA